MLTQNLWRKWIQAEMTVIAGHLRVWYINRGQCKLPEIMALSLVKSSSNGGYKALTGNHLYSASLRTGAITQQQNLQHIICPPARCAGVMMTEKLWKWPANGWSNLRSMKGAGTHAWHWLNWKDQRQNSPETHGRTKHQCTKNVNDMIPSDIRLYLD